MHQLYEKHKHREDIFIKSKLQTKYELIRSGKYAYLAGIYA